MYLSAEQWDFMRERAGRIAEAHRVQLWWTNLSCEQKEDPFFLSMAHAYYPEHSPGWAIRNAVLDSARACGSRFVSLSQRDFIIFEGLRIGGGYFGTPLAWEIGDRLKISAGCGNGAQRQVSLCGWNGGPMLDEIGVYDLRGETPVRLHDALELGQFTHNGVDAKYEDGSDLHQYFVRAGLERPRRYYTNASRDKFERWPSRELLEAL